MSFKNTNNIKNWDRNYNNHRLKAEMHIIYANFFQISKEFNLPAGECSQGIVRLKIEDAHLWLDRSLDITKKNQITIKEHYLLNYIDIIQWALNHPNCNKEYLFFS